MITKGCSMFKSPTIKPHPTIAGIFTIVFLLSLFSISIAQTLPSESPQEFKPTNYGLEYERRDVMIPMRDGVKLDTVIIVPKSVIDSKKHAPMLLTGTPYNATEL